MHIFQHTAGWQKCLGFGLQVTRYALTASLALLLILAWILTAWIFRLAILLSDIYRARLDPKM
jgi:hypothetical protein